MTLTGETGTCADCLFSRVSARVLVGVLLAAFIARMLLSGWRSIGSFGTRVGRVMAVMLDWCSRWVFATVSAAAGHVGCRRIYVCVAGVNSDRFQDWILKIGRGCECGE